MNEIVENNLMEIIKDKLLYPSEKKKEIENNVPINELLFQEKTNKWIDLFYQYLNVCKNNIEVDQLYSNEENLSNPFSSFFKEFLEIASRYLDSSLKSQVNNYDDLSRICNLTSIKNDIMKFIHENLVYVSIRTLIQDLNEEREKGNLIGDTPKERYNFYVDQILSSPDKKFELIKKYPVLVRILIEFILNKIDSIVESIYRFLKDRSELVHIFHLSDDDILTSLTLQSGDSHNNGRSVIIFQFSSKKKIVYKPRSLSIDLHFQQFLEWINGKKPSLQLKTITILNKDQYGWQEFVEYKPCSSNNELSRFYERQGNYIAILYILNATDFHFENLIANGEHPVLIDLEGLVQNTVKLPRKASSAYDIAFSKLTDSVLSTGMLPATFMQANIYDFDLSGLGGDEGQPTGLETFTIENPLTDEMRVIKVPAFSQSSKNKPYLKEEKEIAVTDYSSEIIKGFREMYTLLLHNKKELLSQNGPIYLFKGDKVRIILRSTQVYSTFLDSSFHPDYLKDGYERERLINFLWIGKENHPEYQDAIMYECRDILNGDIPYFYCYTDSSDLYHPIGIVKHNFFYESSFNSLLEKVKMINEEDLNFQIEILTNSLLAQYSNKTHSHANVSNRVYNLDKISGNFRRESFLEVSEKIADNIKENAIFGKENDVTWLGLNLTIEDKWTFKPLDFDLYDGVLGIGLFYANLYNLNKRKEYKILAEKTVQTALNYLEYYPAKLPLSAFYGYGAYAYVLGNFSIIFNNSEYLTYVKKVLNKAANTIEDDQLLDFLGGAAGLIIVCIHLYKKTGEQYLLDIANKCGELLLRKKEKQAMGIGWRPNQVNKPLAGLAHGSSGFTWALMALYKFTKNYNYKETFLQSFEYEKSLFNKKEENWLVLSDDGDYYGNSMWCHGAAGIGMSRIMMSEYYNSHDLKNDIEIAIRQTLKSGFGGTHCLCHGDLGNLDLFLLASSKFKNEEMKETALKIGEYIASDITYGNLKYGTPSGTKNLGLMLGQAGIGYGFLRLAYPEIVPSVLTLQLNH
ncbi:type 2 lanthipeptide synthetase LanM family protein [Geobacillus thermodenitrificans]|uniref:Lantibiotic mersacidin modifying enzyme n=1 Tax=Geobacillus thermodenitrificans (strain NG80-2) TaxID=420246 RepID=A4IQ10_GEOTN|nr:type 2 lanthipeptide synthetase LanM family protein [Geobacillus thermodenitrificans]ABO67414.1 Lantibiotic mersacidin modifying enzyme [Geobacillus thermodenitrificans NG80-2]